MFNKTTTQNTLLISQKDNYFYAVEIKDFKSEYNTLYKAVRCGGTESFNMVANREMKEITENVGKSFDRLQDIFAYYKSFAKLTCINNIILADNKQKIHTVDTMASLMEGKKESIECLKCLC